ncbi:hypothetical protein Mapa_010421 [Marchantia paleacea]|nr:hypothetical protein Mapa_010421 [Marchantia paleacea]
MRKYAPECLIRNSIRPCRTPHLHRLPPHPTPSLLASSLPPSLPIFLPFSPSLSEERRLACVLTQTSLCPPLSSALPCPNPVFSFFVLRLSSSS